MSPGRILVVHLFSESGVMSIEVPDHFLAGDDPMEEHDPAFGVRV
jgi:hypothetical protein